MYFGKSFDEHMFLRRDDAFRKIYFQLDGIANELDEPRLKKSWIFYARKQIHQI